MDTRTTTRWAADELVWLERRARVRGHGKVGTVVREVVQAAMRGESAALARAAAEAAAGQFDGAPAARGETAGGSAGGVGTVAGAPAGHGRGAAVAGPAPRPGAAAALPAALARRGEQRVRLDAAVAVLMQGGGRMIPGLQSPAALIRARRAIADGRVRVSGRGPQELAPGLIVGPGEVEVIS